MDFFPFIFSLTEETTLNGNPLCPCGWCAYTPAVWVYQPLDGFATAMKFADGDLPKGFLSLVS